MRTRATSLQSVQRKLLYAPHCACENLWRHSHIDVGHSYGHSLSERDERVANRCMRMFFFLLEHPGNAPGMEIENLSGEKMPVTRKRRECLVPLAEKVNHSHTLSPAMQTLHRRRRFNAAAAATKGPATKITRGILLEIPNFFYGETFEKPLLKLEPEISLPASVPHRRSNSYCISDKLAQRAAIHFTSNIDSQASQKDASKFRFIISPPLNNGNIKLEKAKYKHKERDFAIDLVLPDVNRDRSSPKTKRHSKSHKENVPPSSLDAKVKPIVPATPGTDGVSDSGNILPDALFQGSHWEIFKVSKRSPNLKPRNRVLSEMERRMVEGPKETVRRWKSEAAKETRYMQEMKATEELAKKNRDFEEWSRTCSSIEENMSKFAEELTIRKNKEARQKKIDRAKADKMEKKEIIIRAEALSEDQYAVS
ncbi:uncharacterized protein LAJ45_07288 [Morchella importuna]|nr:uncharacterized protein LAJ45_07288 [Morchella importuna]KAH8148577.1 hypothetical protein LAJ45_07288 [Morchella importuna]